MSLLKPAREEEVLQSESENQPSYSQEPKRIARGVSWHPTLLDWAEKDAEALGYSGGASALVNGLVFFNHILTRLGKKHWLTVELVNNSEQLDSAIKEIEQEPPDKWGRWLDVRVQERAEVLAKEMLQAELKKRGIAE